MSFWVFPTGIQTSAFSFRTNVHIKTQFNASPASNILSRTNAYIRLFIRTYAYMPIILSRTNASIQNNESDYRLHTKLDLMATCQCLDDPMS